MEQSNLSINIREIYKNNPIEFHCHGISNFDFSELNINDLVKIDNVLKQEKINCLLTLFLPQSKLDFFVEYMNKFHEMKSLGKLNNIIGISLEGPLLSSVGGTPKTGNWRPNHKDWNKIFQCGRLGLKYVVLAPDIHLASPPYSTKEYPQVEWIVEGLLSNNISVALGHFQKSNPQASAESIERVVAIARKLKKEKYGGAILIDHFLNDMPQLIKHAWRGKDEQTKRISDLFALQMESWTLNNLDSKIGIVPATILRYAYEGDITICLNFDGEHVDLEISKRIVELIGDDSIIAMTDRANIENLCGQKLFLKDKESLLYQSHDVVAAGTSNIDLQINNMLEMGISVESAWKMAYENPLRALNSYEKMIIKN
ncbi:MULTISPECIES: N-acetylglucosamine-6-phosphate deacetylase [Bacillus cereus group]|uniref:N-acetylglucosamine-6-phosphate deacetylase n=1 Tax=Bacillus proteolyticus TaxID=2026192 RepID=A0ABV3IFM2_9BACI|nr:N-acetylglucosamine-6-phosphate deacetylase [Bacillus cereus group sp. N8]MBJ8107557.1 N-acetylglucosamine-6-phosphate deacetylase [Bacillus cereus group sp. N8]